MIPFENRFYSAAHIKYNVYIYIYIFIDMKENYLLFQENN